jgi:thioredoxin reductase (NADPH)
MDDAQLLIAAHPVLPSELLERLAAYGTPRDVVMGDLVFDAGDIGPDLIVLISATVDLVRVATIDADSEVLARYEPGEFLGELNLLTGERTFVAGRVAEAGRLVHVSPTAFRRVMSDEPDLSDILLRAFIARRSRLQHLGGARSIQIVGSPFSAASLALRTFAARQQLAHTWFDADEVDGRSLMRGAGLATGDLPAVILPDAVLRRATPGRLAGHVGLSVPHDSTGTVDLAVIGAGPAGLAAAMYGASEGLATVLLEAVATGGQAASSSRIENYLGFPSGLSGAELTTRATVQAEKFGAHVYSPSRVVRLEADSAPLRLVLDDDTVVHSKAVVIATGAHYRSLPLAGWDRFEGAGIYYAATDIEARSCGAEQVVVIGGANSSGQAALFLAERDATVTIAARRSDLESTMSSYLLDRLRAHPRVTIRTSTEVTALHGGASLDGVTLWDHATGAHVDVGCRGLFCFIGAEPATSWLQRPISVGAAAPSAEAQTAGQVLTDSDGFVMTDVSLTTADPLEAYRLLGRSPLPFETSIPGVFAAGDVRHGSMKRVAAAVGEGASAVHSVHAAIRSRV